MCVNETENAAVKKAKKAYREHEKHPLKVSKVVLFERSVKTRPGIREPIIHGGAACGAKLQKQNALLLLMVITDSSPLEPVPELLLLDADGFIQIARPEHVGVEDPIDELGRLVRAPSNEAHHDHAVGRGRV